MKRKGWGLTLSLYAVLFLVLGLLTMESYSYYLTSRGMSVWKAVSFAVLVEALLFFLFLSERKRFKIIGWLLFSYSTVTSGLWVFHQDAAKVARSDEEIAQKRNFEEKREFLRSRIRSIEDEIQILMQGQRKLMDLGHVTKGTRLGATVDTKKGELEKHLGELSALDTSSISSAMVFKAGVVEVDSYSQFFLRLLLQLFVMNFSLLRRKGIRNPF